MLYFLVYICCYVFFKLFFFVRVTGKENLPPKGTPLLVCANHTGYSDPILVTLCFSPFRRIRYMAKAPLFRNRFKAYFLRYFGAFPISQRESDISSIRTSLDILANNETLLVFPEGSRRLRGLDKLEALPGVGLLAYKAGCLILPVFVTPYLSLFCRKTVVIGKPFYPDPIQKGEKPSEVYRKIAAQTLDKILDLGCGIGEGDY